MKANEISQMIRTIVREELKLLLPGMVKEHLAETYIRNIVVSESRTKRGVNEYIESTDVLGDEEVPAPKKNIDKGIYAPGSNTVSKNESRKIKLPDMGGIEKLIFEGTRPVQDEGSAVAEMIPSSVVESMDFSSFMNQMDNVVESKKAVDTSYETKMRELEMRRKALDVPAVKVR